MRTVRGGHTFSAPQTLLFSQCQHLALNTFSLCAAVYLLMQLKCLAPGRNSRTSCAGYSQLLQPLRKVREWSPTKLFPLDNGEQRVDLTPG